MKETIIKCKHRGKEFITNKSTRKFCSKKCSDLHLQHKYLKQGKHHQPCWNCTKACGGCSWSRNLTPVKGWVAEKVPFNTYKKDTSTDYTYQISYCPEYEKEVRKRK